MSVLRKYIFRRNSTTLSQIIGGGGESTPTDTQFIIEDGYVPFGSVREMIITQDSNLLSIGDFSNYNLISTADYIMKTDLSGNYNTSFTPTPNNWPKSITEQSNGKIILGGAFTEIGGVSKSYLVRLNVDGTLDTTFNNNNPTIDNYIVDSRSIHIDNQDRIIVLATESTTYNGNISHNGIFRLLSDGTYDTTFNAVTFDVTPSSMKVLSDDSIIVSGFFQSVNGQSICGLAKLDSSGNLDSSFNHNPSKFYPTGGGSSYARIIETLSDGSIIVGNIVGRYGTYQNTVDIGAISKFDSNGNLDTNFNINITDSNIQVYTLHIQSDNKIIVGGSNITTVDGTNVSGIYRINSDGTLDTSFNNGGSGFECVNMVPDQPTVFDIVSQSNGNLIVGGLFDTYNNQTHNLLVKLTSDGELIPNIVTIDGISYTEVVSPYTGRVWLDRNLGATQVATSISDSDGYGWLYQWGRLTDNHQLRNSTAVYGTQATDYANAGTNFISNSSGDWLTPSNNNLWNTLNTEDFPEGYSVPTKAEWEAEELGIRNEFGTSNLTTWNNSFLKISAAGKRTFDNPSLEGTYGAYWSRDVSTSSSAHCLVLYTNSGNMSGDLKAAGQSVRLIKDVS